MLVFSAAALKCGARDQWIGWDYRHQYDRLNLLANNSRFLTLPNSHHKNLASKILSLCHKWNEEYGSVDESLAIDGKTMCKAIDESGRQIHIMSVVGHQSGQCYTKKNRDSPCSRQ